MAIRFGEGRSSPSTPETLRLVQIPAREAAELVSAPGLLSGDVSVDADSKFDTAGFRVHINLSCCLRCGCNPCGCPRSTENRVDLLLGFRHAGLDESLVIRGNLTSLETANPGNFGVVDRFDTQNEFHGSKIGILWDMTHGCWSLKLLANSA